MKGKILKHFTVNGFGDKHINYCATVDTRDIDIFYFVKWIFFAPAYDRTGNYFRHVFYA